MESKSTHSKILPKVVLSNIDDENSQVDFGFGSGSHFSPQNIKIESEAKYASNSQMSLGGFPAMDELHSPHTPKSPTEQPEIKEEKKQDLKVSENQFSLDSNPIQFVGNQSATKNPPDHTILEPSNNQENNLGGGHTFQDKKVDPKQVIQESSELPLPQQPSQPSEGKQVTESPVLPAKVLNPESSKENEAKSPKKKEDPFEDLFL